MQTSSHSTLRKSANGFASWAVIVCACLLTSCAYTRPYISLDPELGTIPTGEPRAVKRAVKKLEVWAKEAEAKRDGVSELRRGLDLATFVLAVGTGGAALYGANRDIITGLALGAATTYAGSALFLPYDQALLYNAAVVALSCVRAKGAAFESAVKTASEQRTNLSSPDALEKVRRAGGKCIAGPAVDSQFSRADQARVVALNGLDQAGAADASVATKIEEAGRNVVNALNQEISQRAPRVDTILDAAKSVASLALGLSAGAADSAGSLVLGVPKPAPEGVRRCTDEENANLTAQLASMETSYRSLEKALVESIQSVGTLDTTCVFSAPAAEPLSISQEAVTLSKDVTFNVIVTGGRVPYTVSWLGSTPAGEVTFQMIPPRTIALFGTSKITSTTKLELVVRDSSAVPQSKKITISGQ